MRRYIIYIQKFDETGSALDCTSLVLLVLNFSWCLAVPEGATSRLILFKLASDNWRMKYKIIKTHG